MNSITKVRSQVRTQRDRYNNERTDENEPIIDLIGEESKSELKNIFYSVYSSDGNNEREEFIDSELKTNPHQISILQDRLKNGLKSSQNRYENGNNNYNLEDNYKFSRLSNYPSLKTPIFLSQNEENSELRKTAKRNKIVDLAVIHKSDEETEHYLEHRKIEELFTSDQENLPQQEIEELEIHLSEENEKKDSEHQNNFTIEKTGTVKIPRKSTRY